MSEKTPLKNPPSSPQKNIDASKTVSPPAKSNIDGPLAENGVVPTIEEEPEIVNKEEKIKFLAFLKKYPEIIPLSRTNKQKWVNYFLKTQENYYNILTGTTSTEKSHKANEELQFSNQYCDEKTLNPGDFVIVFPNPDHNKYKSSIDFTYNFPEVTKILTKVLLAPMMAPIAKIKDHILMRMFSKVFKELTDADKIGKKTKFIQRLLDKTDGKININNPNLYSDLKISQKTEKINIKGGFMKEKNGKWFRTGETVRDLCTLIRHLVILKLTKEMGFKTRMFLSNDGDEIYLVLHADENNLREMAEEVEMDKEIDISMCNLTCLEPIDLNFRPLRLHSSLLTKWNKEDDVRIDIIKLLEEINFQKISKECGDKFYVNNKKKPDIMDEPIIPMLTWKAYKFYLTKVAEKVKNVRSLLLSDESRSNYMDDAEKDQLTRNLKDKKYPPLDPRFPSKKSTLIRKRKEAVLQAPNTKIIMVKRKEQLTKHYKKILNETLKETKQHFGRKHFRSLWDHLGFESPLEPFTDYFNPGKKVSFRSKFKTKALWKKYEISEMGNFSQFPMVDKLKIIRIMMDKLFNLSDLKETGYITYYFFLNDPFYLYGTSKINLFKPLLPDLPDEKIDFSKETYFKNPKPVGKTWDILTNWRAVIKVPEIPIKDYYGEKIALYYKFFNYFIFQLLLLTPIAVICFFVSTAAQNGMAYVDDYADDEIGNIASTKTTTTELNNMTYSDSELFSNLDPLDKIDVILTIIFGISLAVWSNLFVSIWNPRENIFKIKNGQSDAQEDEQVRSKYEGNFKRSLIDDKINDECDDGKKRLVVQIFGLLLALFLLALNVGVIISMEFLSRRLAHDFKDGDVGYLEFKVAVPALINYIFISIINDIYYYMSKKLTEKENHKFASSFQNSFVQKVVFFQIINTIIPFVIFDFIYYIVRNSVCGGTDCWDYTNVYFRTFIYCYGVKYIFQAIFPIFLFYYKKLEFMVLSTKIDEKDPYCQINTFIEIERLKFDFAINDELDGTINSYMGLTVNFAMNSLFGILFPMSFPASFGLFFLSLHLSKKVLMNATTRPQPTNAANIGAFKQLLQLIGYLSAITNAAILAGPSDCIQEQRLLGFIIIMLAIFLIRFIVESILGEKSEVMCLAEERNKMIVEKTVKSFVQKAGGYKFERKPPIFKVFGCLLPEKKQIEQISQVIQPALKKSAVVTTKK